MRTIIFLAGLLCLWPAWLPGAEAAAGAASRVFIVYSYHPGYFWQDGETEGIEAALSGLDVEYDSCYLDSKLHPGEERLRQRAATCREKISRFRPDVILTCDDNASRIVGAGFQGRRTPVVFLGLNGEPEEYGLVQPGRRQRPGGNITGVLERHYYQDVTYLLQTILLANRIECGNLYLLTDASYTSKKLFSFLRQAEWKTPWKKHFLPPVHTFSQYKEVFREINRPGNVIFFYNLESLVDAGGRHVDSSRILDWSRSQLRVPAVAFHPPYLQKGLAMCGIVVTGYSQGYHAGLLARQILHGTPPGEIPVARPPKGTVILNVSLARKMGLKIPLAVLLGADIVHDRLEVSRWR